MVRRLLQGVVLVASIVLIPSLANLPVLRAPHMWLLMIGGIMASLCQPGYNPVTIMRKRGDRGTGAQILWSIYLVQVLAVLEATYLRYPASMRWDTVSTVAAVIIFLGLILRTWAVHTLGSRFTMHIEVQAGHRISERGPYRFVRHPAYLGALMTYLAAPLLLHAWGAALFGVAMLPSAFLRRIHHEELRLRKATECDYERYCHNVKCLVPGLW